MLLLLFALFTITFNQPINKEEFHDPEGYFNDYDEALNYFKSSYEPSKPEYLFNEPIKLTDAELDAIYTYETVAKNEF